MRPVDRGAVPVDEAGVIRVFAHYHQVRDPLIQRIGDYCSYCEVALNASIDVEHVRPKKPNPGLALTWNNFLLGCDYCNPIEGDTDVVLANYFWPDNDNTFRAFEYSVDLPPQIAGGLSPAQREQRNEHCSSLDWTESLDTLSLVNEIVAGPGQGGLGVALLSLGNLQRIDTEETRRQIVFTAVSRGFFCVWMSVFQGDANMRRRFIQSFIGTATNCFNAEGNPIPRPGGAL